MPTTLATNYLGSNAAAVLLTGGSATRIYYQSADGSIHDAAGTGAAVNNPVYTERIVVAAEKVRINSPIAVVASNLLGRMEIRTRYASVTGHAIES